MKTIKNYPNLFEEIFQGKRTISQVLYKLKRQRNKEWLEKIKRGQENV